MNTDWKNRSTRTFGWRRAACSVLAALGLAVALSGCIIVPEHHDHPHYWGY